MEFPRWIAGFILLLMGALLIGLGVLMFVKKDEAVKLAPTTEEMAEAKDSMQTDVSSEPSKEEIASDMKIECSAVAGFKDNVKTNLCTISVGPLSCALGTGDKEPLRAVSCYGFRDVELKTLQWRGCVTIREKGLANDLACVQTQGVGESRATCLLVRPKRSRTAELISEAAPPLLAMDCQSGEPVH